MRNNVSGEDLRSVIDFLGKDVPVLTQSRQVEEFEREWSRWLGVRHSVFVNSGSSANLITIAALKHLYGAGDIIVPTLTWVSDIASVIHNGFHPVFVDIDLGTLGMDATQVIGKISSRTKAVFLTHVLGYNALSDALLNELERLRIPLIEDACESHGTTFRGRKVGTFGLASNFSFYYAHHLTTIEGGMVCTDNVDFYQCVRMFRSHGLVRESTDAVTRQKYEQKYDDLTPDFIFAFPAYNVRSTEINAVIGRSQLQRIDENNRIRSENLQLFLANLDPAKYHTDFTVLGSSNYAFTLVLKRPDTHLRDDVIKTLRASGVEFRRGTSGGGNQLRQPYLREVIEATEYSKYPNVEHIHFFGFYIGNYPGLEKQKIFELCARLNELRHGT
jgi:CDP-6-deoxy-D-xylo-4-hexulose-3-dehydrase